MPTPRPIIVPSSGAADPTSVIAASNVIPERPIASPKSAVAIGSPAAMSEPNAKIRITIANSSPTWSDAELRGASA